MALHYRNVLMNDAILSHGENISRDNNSHAVSYGCVR